MSPVHMSPVVRGRRADQGGVRAYVLEQRIVGHDSYRPAELVLASGVRVPVRVLTLDDVTVIYPLAPEFELPDAWEGTLRLADTSRAPAVPSDLAKALAAAGIDPDRLDPAQRRHLVGFVAEARPGPTRDARLAAAVEAAVVADVAADPDFS